MKKSQLLFSDNVKSARLIYIIKKYREAGQNPLGRTIMQKICYFLTFAKVPLPYSFKMYFYGPFSQELLSDMEFIQIDGLIEDENKDSDSSNYRILEEGEKLLLKFDEEFKNDKKKIDSIVKLVINLSAKKMELFSTTHYIFWAYKNYYGKNQSKEFVIDKVYKIKNSNFTKEEIEEAFDKIQSVGMFKDLN